jgi:hypothetical protein
MSLTLSQLRAQLQAAKSTGNVDSFAMLREVARYLNATRGTADEVHGQELVIRLLDIQHLFQGHIEILDSFVREAGLFPYLQPDRLGIADAIAYETHRPSDSSDTVFHRVQAQVFQHLMAGQSVVLSAPTSFGKSLIVDAVVASQRFSNIVIVVPTLALLDETRRRLTRYSGAYKVITHSSQEPGERNIFVHTQERVVENEHIKNTDFFVVDEFYKLNPTDEAERAQMLNLAFHKLAKQAKQFYMLGPNIENIPQSFVERYQCRFIRTDFNTVVSEIHRFDVDDDVAHAVELCSGLKEPTLIYVRSPGRAHDIATLLAKSVGDVGTDASRETADWVASNYHPEWSFASALSAGIGIHHGRLPRSLTQLVVRRFNEGALRYLVCTSTLIEGVNTRAKHIVVLDNKVAARKFDYFTFSNIRGRSGRMLKHFIGHVYIYHEPPQPELPLVDIPIVTQSDEASDALLIQLEPHELKQSSANRVDHFYVDETLSLEVMRKNAGIDPSAQLRVAEFIERNLEESYPMLAWQGYPYYEQLKYACELAWEHFTDRKRRAGVSSGSQLTFLLNRLLRAKKFSEAVELFERNEKHVDDAIEELLEFQRQWAEFRAPNLLSALGRIQAFVFEKRGLRPGIFEPYVARLENLGRSPVVNALDEYGLPTQIGEVVWDALDKPETLDETLSLIRENDYHYTYLSAFENGLVDEVRSSLLAQ